MEFMREEGWKKFQSTLSWGERHEYVQDEIGNWKFQSTLSWGERPACAGSRQKKQNFNPRSPGESDNLTGQKAVLAEYFNPRSPGESDIWTGEF